MAESKASNGKAKKAAPKQTAKKSGASEPETRPEPEAEPEAQAVEPTGLDAAELAERVSEQLDATVRLPELGGDGKPKLTKDGAYKMIERPVTAADILAVKRRGDRIVCTTVDGQKLQVAAR